MRTGMFVGCVFALTLTVTTPAWGQPQAQPQQAATTVEACIEASEQGQRDRDEGKLQSARDHFVSCANASCPKVIRNDCTAWLEQLKGMMASVLVVITDARGHDVVNASLTIDGQATHVTAHAIPLDPGEHALRISYAGQEPIERTILLRQGEQNRRIEIVFPDLQLPSTTPGSTGEGADASPLATVATWTLGGLATVSTALYIGFGVSALTRRDELEDICAPNCELTHQGEIDSAERDLVIANVAFGIGVASAAGTVIAAIIGQPENPATPDVSVNAGGASAHWTLRW